MAEKTTSRFWKNARKLCCLMGHHFRPSQGTLGYDGFILCGRCPVCGVNVLHASDGSWFENKEKTDD